MTEMTTHERMTRVFNHQEADRCPVTDEIWASTLERWHREGMPEEAPLEEYFGLDHVVAIGADNSPRFPVQVIQETDEWIEETTSWGAHLRRWKHAGGVPEFLDFIIKDPDSWRMAKERMAPDRDRVDWDRLAREYPKWREQGAWVMAGGWFGFDVLHSDRGGNGARVDGHDRAAGMGGRDDYPFPRGAVGALRYDLGGGVPFRHAALVG